MEENLILRLKLDTVRRSPSIAAHDPPSHSDDEEAEEMEEVIVEAEPTQTARPPRESASIETMKQSPNIENKKRVRLSLFS